MTLRVRPGNWIWALGWFSVLVGEGFLLPQGSGGPVTLERAETRNILPCSNMAVDPLDCKSPILPGCVEDWKKLDRFVWIICAYSTSRALQKIVSEISLRGLSSLDWMRVMTD